MEAEVAQEGLQRLEDTAEVGSLAAVWEEVHFVLLVAVTWPER